MSYNWARPGVEVVCVNGREDDVRVLDAPITGHRYTIRDVGMTPKGNTGVRVHGLNFRSAIGFWHGPRRCSGDEFIGAVRFRPLTKHSTDKQVEELRKLLNATPADLEGVDA